MLSRCVTRACLYKPWVDLGICVEYMCVVFEWTFFSIPWSMAILQNISVMCRFQLMSLHDACIYLFFVRPTRVCVPQHPTTCFDPLVQQQDTWNLNSVCLTYLSHIYTPQTTQMIRSTAPTDTSHTASKKQQRSTQQPCRATLITTYIPCCGCSIK